MGWLLVGAFLGIVSIGISASQADAELDQQEEQNRITNYDKSIDEINNATTNIENTLIDIKTIQSKNDTHQSTIDTGNEWIDNYQKMLNGDRSETVLGRQLYSLEGNLQTAKENKSVYEASARTQKQTAYDEAFSSYTQMLKQKSLLNVAASGTGQMEGAYSASQLLQTESIRRFIGNDMIFNSDGEGTSLADGSFLMSYSALKREIKANIDNLSLQIDYAYNAISDFYDTNETTYNQWQADIEDASKAINVNNETIDLYKARIQNEQNNAITALKDAIKYNGGEDDMNQLNSYAERLDTANSQYESHTGASSGYDATDTVTKAKEEADRKAKEEAEAAANQETEHEPEDIETVADKTRADKTAERDNEKGKALTEKIKNSDEYQQQQAERNANAANEKGKSQTDYYNKQTEDEDKNKKKTNKEKGKNKRVTQ